MPLIKNFVNLATTPSRKVVLQLIKAALLSIQPQKIMEDEFSLLGSILNIKGKDYDLKSFDRIFVVGFGKGSSGICKFIENSLGEGLTEGWDIDIVTETFKKIRYTKGTHPLPSATNVKYTEDVLANLQNLSEKDLVLVVINGGGSALFESPVIPLPRLSAVNSELLKSGATISEINVIRKHLSNVKGGKLAEKLFPAKIIGLIFSDVPGNDLSVIASSPTVKDNSSIEDAKKIIKKYSLTSVMEKDFVETTLNEKYFSNVENIIMVSNQTALIAMKTKAKELGFKSVILTDRLEGDSKKIGEILLSETRKKEILLAGGETTVKVRGNGIGGRNQTLVLASLKYINQGEIIAAFDSDGWDFTTYAGAIGDERTFEKAKELGLDIDEYLDNDNSTVFFQKTGDGIDTGKLESNVSDLFIVFKN